MGIHIIIHHKFCHVDFSTAVMRARSVISVVIGVARYPVSTTAQPTPSEIHRLRRSAMRVKYAQKTISVNGPPRMMGTVWRETFARFHEAM